MKPYYEYNGVTLYLGDCREVMPTLNPVHAIICDPPYELGFMGKAWDKTGIANDVKMWAECLRVLRPGGHLLSFGGSRTYHRMACAIEDAGFEIRDQIMWLYGSGFPKSLDVSKAIDKAAGADREVTGVVDTRGSFDGRVRASAAINSNWREAEGREDTRDLSKKVISAPSTDAAKQWEGWGTALKPAHEPICVARKPIEGTVAANVLKHGTGALNIKGCRIGNQERPVMVRTETIVSASSMSGVSTGATPNGKITTLGRWPANVIHDGSDEVVSLFPQTSSGELRPYSENHQNATSFQMHRDKTFIQDANSGSSARFFYTAKASQDERGIGNNHPTVKPLELMAYLCKLLCPPSGGVLLDPFMGSGSTIIAGRRFYQHCIGIELEEKYAEIAAKRLSQEIFDFGETA
jgi:site-specific DNA-methyltransferase (adenine-specific)